MAKWIRRFLICKMLLLLVVGQILAVDDEQINADKLDRLESLFQINYEDFDVEIEVGWFVANDVATEFVVFDNEQMLHQISQDGDIIMSWQYAENEEQLIAVIDGIYFDDEFYILYTLDNHFWINDFEFLADGVPLALGRDEEFIYVEAQVENALIVYQLDNDLQVIDQFDIANDTSEPVIRVGRITIPIIVQTTFAGLVEIFDFDEQLGVYQVGDGPTVFGHVNYEHSHFAWSDPNSTNLNLLNIETGQNTSIAGLDNLYAQYYLLSHDASLVVAINIDFEPIIVAWNTITGERHELGTYRDCERIPDRVQFSADGTTLIIGCDKGLELWQVVPHDN